MHGAALFTSDNNKEQDEAEEKKKLVMSPIRPCCLNAFDIISRSQGFDLSGLFEEKGVKAEARFTSQKPATMIGSKLEGIAQVERFKMIKKKDGVVKLERSKKGRKGQLEIEAEIFEVSSALFLVEMKKLSGDALEYHKFYQQEMRPSLKDIVWTWQVGDQSPPPQTPALSPLRPISVPAGHPECIF